MCVVKDIEECAKKVYIYMKNGEAYSSQWFFDEERKNSYGENNFTELEKEKYDELIDENGLEPKDIGHWTVNRDKSLGEDCIFISRHGFERMRERNGWNKKTAIRMVKKVFDEGLAPDEVKGEFRPWVRHRAEKHPEGILKFYGQSLYIFENGILVTVLPAVKLYKQDVAC